MKLFVKRKIAASQHKKNITKYIIHILTITLTAEPKRDQMKPKARTIKETYNLVC